MPAEPSFYLNVPSRIDPTAAPEGRDSIVVLVPVGHISKNLPEGSDWEVIVNKARDHVYETLASRLGLKDLRKWTVNEIINDPITWQDKVCTPLGVIGSALILCTVQLASRKHSWFEPQLLVRRIHLVSRCRLTLR